MQSAVEFVFGYGSLAARSGGGSGAQAAYALRIATLVGAVRVWGVAMDNAETIPGYKYYVDPVTGERPPVHVTFLDVADAPGVECVGFLLPVGAGAAALDRLGALDRRERNYDRVDATARVRCEPALSAGTRIWVYRGSKAARARFDAAAAAGSAVIQRAYLEGVEAEFAASGLAERYTASTRLPDCPVVDLTRVDVPE